MMPWSRGDIPDKVWAQLWLLLDTIEAGSRAAAEKAREWKRKL